MPSVRFTGNFGSSCARARPNTGAGLLPVGASKGSERRGPRYDCLGPGTSEGSSDHLSIAVVIVSRKRRRHSQGICQSSRVKPGTRLNSAVLWCKTRRRRAIHFLKTPYPRLGGVTPPTTDFC